MLRQAFDAMLSSPEFLDDARRGHFDIQLVTGAELDDITRKIMSTPIELANKAGLGDTPRE